MNYRLCTKVRSIVKLHRSGRWKSEFLLIFSQQIIHTPPGANIPHPRYKVVYTEDPTLQYMVHTLWEGALVLYGYNILLVGGCRCCGYSILLLV